MDAAIKISCLLRCVISANAVNTVISWDIYNIYVSNTITFRDNNNNLMYSLWRQVMTSKKSPGSQG